ncbi:MAG: symmetrical bis(5'-nucleosyl)-tetraphosphatase [Betaproteobacteria bacterium]|nr:symmetrical bis(5'-nucleosyl)-tetraphosphatase [Betaproteobacteria bacterium]
MATYVIGDLQGCLDPLQRLLDKVNFDSSEDRLWFVGDLVNRGPDSLGVLRFVRDLGTRAVCVLGNHDLHLVVAAAGFGRMHREDTFQDVLEAPDRDALVEWLRHRPLFHVEGPWALVHAGVLPQWTIEQAAALARETEALLQSDRSDEFLRTMYGNHPDHWDDTLTGWDRARVVVNAMTRLRVCTSAGTMEFRHKGPVSKTPSGFMPWFDVPDRLSRTHTILFGHWSALGFSRSRDYVALDSGCLWGRQLTAWRLEDETAFQIACPARAD